MNITIDDDDGEYKSTGISGAQEHPTKGHVFQNNVSANKLKLLITIAVGRLYIKPISIEMGFFLCTMKLSNPLIQTSFHNLICFLFTMGKTSKYVLLIIGLILGVTGIISNLSTALSDLTSAHAQTMLILIPLTIVFIASMRMSLKKTTKHPKPKLILGMMVVVVVVVAFDIYPYVVGKLSESFRHMESQTILTVMCLYTLLSLAVLYGGVIDRLKKDDAQIAY